MKTVPVQDLQPGQRIFVSDGSVHTVTEPTVAAGGLAEIICGHGTALTGLPCDAQVVD
jgi:hypothetical protein